jgi:hypothetical protein
MFPVWMPPELKAHLIEAGIALPPPAKPRAVSLADITGEDFIAMIDAARLNANPPRDPVSDASARDGVIRQHVPAPGQEPNF